MRRDSVSQKSLAALLVLLLSAPAHASVFGEENAALAALVAQGIEEINQASQTIATAREQLEFAKDVYAGINYFTTFDPQAFLEQEKSYFLTHIQVAAEASSLVTEVTSGRITGGSADSLYNRFDAFRDAQRRRQAKQGNGRVAPYDANRALTLSAETEEALGDPTQRGRLTGKPDVATVSDGLLEADMSRVDPALLNLYLARRAAAKEAEYQAFKLYAEAIGASPGKAQQLAALAAGLSAQELARIDHSLAQANTAAQLERHERSVAKANEKAQVDFVWDDIQKTAESAQPPSRGSLDWEPLP